MGKKAKVFKPGDYVFAKVKGYPAWPAKISSLNGKKYSIYFYGTGETGNLPANDIFDYFEHKQQFLAKALKRRDYNDGLAQIESETVELGVTSNENRPDVTTESVESDANNTADTTAEDDAEQSLDTTAAESEPPPTPTPEPVKVPKKRNADASANATPAKVRKVDKAPPPPPPSVEAESANESVEMAEEAKEQPSEPPTTDADASQVVAPAEEATPAETAAVEAVKTPVGRGRKPSKTPTVTIQKPTRRSAKQEVMSPTFEPHNPAPESVSRSGRKIKPKRHFEEDASENAPQSTPIKKVKIGTATPLGPTAPTPDDDNVTNSEHEAGTQTNSTPLANDAPKRGRKKSIKPVTKVFNYISKNELENLHEPPTESSGQVQKENVLPVLLPNGKLVAIKLFKEMPEVFASPSAQSQWMSTVIKNAIRLKHELESGRIKSESILNQLETDLPLNSEESTVMKREQDNELKKRKLGILKVECKLVELEKSIRTALSYKSADVDFCIQTMDEIQELNITKLMLLKQPGIVQVIKQVRRYVGNVEQWQFTPDELATFVEKRDVLQKKAHLCFDKFKSLFDMTDDKKFIDMYSQLRVMFTVYTKNLNEQEVIEMVDEPMEMTQPNTFSASIVDEELKKEKGGTKKSAANDSHTKNNKQQNDESVEDATPS